MAHVQPLPCNASPLACPSNQDAFCDLTCLKLCRRGRGDCESGYIYGLRALRVQYAWHHLVNNLPEGDRVAYFV